MRSSANGSGPLGGDDVVAKGGQARRYRKRGSQGSPRLIVTMLSDFGTVDGFVGAMKGVLLSIAPRAQIVDISHDIPPQDVRSGARALATSAPFFPPGTIHLAVVDPGVGSGRAPLLLRSAAGSFFVGPDNGLLAAAAGSLAVGWRLDQDRLFGAPLCQTFHGRDVFAPAAGFLARGSPPELCATPVQTWVELTETAPSIPRPGEVVGRVVHTDRFGNLVTNVPGRLLHPAGRWVVWLGERRIGPLEGTYCDVAPGEWVGYLGSSGTVEIAVRDGSAAALASGMAANQEVKLCRE